MAKKMSKEDKEAWSDLYYYVKDNIMGYDENQALSKNMVLRLKGLSTNKFIENKNIESTANYSCEVILATYKYCSNDIKRAFSSKSFESEQHKFLYAAKIVENKINDVYTRMKGVERTKEKIKDVNTTIANYNGAEYKTKQNVKNKEDKFSDLW